MLNSDAICLFFKDVYSESLHVAQNSIDYCLASHGSANMHG